MHTCQTEYFLALSAPQLQNQNLHSHHSKWSALHSGWHCSWRPLVQAGLQCPQWHDSIAPAGTSLQRLRWRAPQRLRWRTLQRLAGALLSAFAGALLSAFAGALVSALAGALLSAFAGALVSALAGALLSAFAGALLSALLARSSAPSSAHSSAPCWRTCQRPRWRMYCTLTGALLEASTLSQSALTGARFPQCSLASVPAP